MKTEAESMLNAAMGLFLLCLIILALLMVLGCATGPTTEQDEERAMKELIEEQLTQAGVPWSRSDVEFLYADAKYRAMTDPAVQRAWQEVLDWSPTPRGIFETPDEELTDFRWPSQQFNFGTLGSMTCLRVQGLSGVPTVNCYPNIVKDRRLP